MLARSIAASNSKQRFLSCLGRQLLLVQQDYFVLAVSLVVLGFQRPDLHRERKSALKPGLTGRILEGYIPRINEVIIDGLSNWTDSGRIKRF